MQGGKEKTFFHGERGFSVAQTDKKKRRIKPAKSARFCEKGLFSSSAATTERQYLAFFEKRWGVQGGRKKLFFHGKKSFFLPPATNPPSFYREPEDGGAVVIQGDVVEAVDAAAVDQTDIGWLEGDFGQVYDIDIGNVDS